MRRDRRGAVYKCVSRLEEIAKPVLPCRRPLALERLGTRPTGLSLFLCFSRCSAAACAQQTRVPAQRERTLTPTFVASTSLHRKRGHHFHVDRAGGRFESRDGDLQLLWARADGEGHAKPLHDNFKPGWLYHAGCVRNSIYVPIYVHNLETPASTTIKFTSTSGIAAGGTITIVGTARTSFAGSDASTCTATKKTGSTIVTLGALTSAILTRQSLVYNLGSVAIAAEDTSSK